MEKKTAILIATQKQQQFPVDAVYLPIQVGAALCEPIDGMLLDSHGENISSRNRSYCELTGVYWAWKNLDADYIGLNHYRRFFGHFGFGSKQSRIAGGADIAAALEKAPVLLPKKRNYFIETNYSQYAHAHHPQDLDETRKILAEFYPDYLASFDAVMKKTTGHRFNMFVMRRDIFDRYCHWLFDVLFRLEERLDTTGYSSYDKRVFGFVAERLMDVWIDCNGVRYTELPVIFTERQNWVKKIWAFLCRKFRAA